MRQKKNIFLSLTEKLTTQILNQCNKNAPLPIYIQYTIFYIFLPILTV